MTGSAEAAGRTTEALRALGATVAGSGMCDEEGRAVAVDPSEHNDSRFELGSVTKLVTGLVLARHVLDRTAALDQPIGTWLDAGPNGGITLAELATHSSGLPRLAPNHAEHRLDANPYGAFTAEMAEEGLRKADLGPKGEYAYSNFGYQLLGLCLERSAGRPLPALFDEMVLGPLGMAGATVDPRETVLQGEDDDGPVANWTLQLHGPGGINAPVRDLLTLADAAVRPPDDTFARMIELATEPRVQGPGASVGFAWLVVGNVVCMGGGTAGFSTYVAADKAGMKSVALAMNRFESERIEACAFAALQGQDPMSVVPLPFQGDPQPPSDVASRLFSSFASDDFAGARALMHPKTAEVLTEERMRQPWSALVEQCGAPGEPAVRDVAREGNRVRVSLEADGEYRALTMVVWLDDDLQVTGVIIR